MILNFLDSRNHSADNRGQATIICVFSIIRVSNAASITFGCSEDSFTHYPARQ